ncbi:hypothetical protein KK062_07390 [Fulvivirgaceae bacterium PWU5]|uniref:DUF5018 domain-containing protein n=1 Tax=Dawidia cretensis TaxID=2782350 RepID=A0AAP2DX79_9BACT|nr:DUF5018 domain-containing protein [Dawidia cretensis]MBT1708039.1 hypothetical protein [Dawidia cretensis]
MMKRFTPFLFACAVALLLIRCDDDEASSPPKSSFTVDKTSGLANDTEFTFVVEQVSAGDISLLPYGTERPNLGGIRITNFKDGKATVTFKYEEVGTFEAVVVTNNHTADGESVKSTFSDPKTVTITSDRKEISDFTFEKSTSTVIDQDARTITIVVPYGTDVTALKAKFAVSAFTTVTVGSTAQTSDGTTNNFTNPVVYTVKSNDGTSVNYTVTVNVTPVEQTFELKGATGKVLAGDLKDKVFTGAVDNDNHTIVLYGPAGTPATAFDEISLNYEMAGKFAYLKFDNKKLKQDTEFDLNPAAATVEAYSQDSLGAGGTQDYMVYGTDAPKLNFSFPSLVPSVEGTVDGFTTTLKVLKIAGTEFSTDAWIEELPAGVTASVEDLEYQDVNGSWVPFSPGDEVDYTKNVNFRLPVMDSRLDGGVTYWAMYKVSVLYLQ